MKILACVNIGDDKTTQSWDLEDDHLIVRRFESAAIAIRLDKSRIRRLTNPEELIQNIAAQPDQFERKEAAIDSASLAHLGCLNFSDAVLIHSN